MNDIKDAYEKFSSAKKQVTLREVSAETNVGRMIQVCIPTVQWNLVLVGYDSRKLTRVSILNARHHLRSLALWRRPHKTIEPNYHQGTLLADNGSTVVSFVLHGVGWVLWSNWMNRRPGMIVLSNLETICIYLRSKKRWSILCMTVHHRARTVWDWFEKHSGNFQRMICLPR